MSAKESLERYYARISNQTVKKNSRKGKPEAEVVAQLKVWFSQNNFLMDVVESKSVFNESAGRYIRGQVVSGFSDFVGCAPTGLACFVEVKAKGRISALKEHQEMFLRARIEKGAFACCVDSVEMIQDLWSRFSNMLKINPTIAKEILVNSLPKRASKWGKPTTVPAGEIPF